MVHMGLLHCKVRYICQKKKGSHTISNLQSSSPTGLQSCATVLYVVSVVHVRGGVLGFSASSWCSTCSTASGRNRRDGQTDRLPSVVGGKWKLPLVQELTLTLTLAGWPLGLRFDVG